jgi:hypothetical protein
LVPWLKREIIALFGSRDMHFVTENTQNIMQITANNGLRSKTMRDYLRERFREYTDPFIREYFAFASSSCNTIEMWDRQAVYKNKTSRPNRTRKQPDPPRRQNSIQTPTPRPHHSNSSESDVEEVRPRNSLNPVPSQVRNPGPRHLIVLSSDDDLGPDAPTPPRPSRPLTPNQPSTSATVIIDEDLTRPSSSRGGRSSSRVTNFIDATNVDSVIGDLNPILNPISLQNIPGPSRLPNRSEFIIEQQRRMNSIYSRIYDENIERDNGQLTASEVYHIARNETRRQTTRHVSRLEMEARRRMEVSNGGTISSDDEVQDDDQVIEINPNIPSAAFVKKIRRHNQSVEDVITIVESDSEIEEERIRPGTSQSRISKQSESSDDSNITDSEYPNSIETKSNQPSKELKRYHPGALKPKPNSTKWNRSITLSATSSNGTNRKRKCSAGSSSSSTTTATTAPTQDSDELKVKIFCKNS